MNQNQRKSLRRWAGVGVMLLVATALYGHTTIDDTDKYSWGANIGWMDWQGDDVNGVQFTETHARGYIYAANIGWICLGNGLNLGTSAYSNTAADDFGVNVDSLTPGVDSPLSGYGYSANVGWINFDVEAQAGSGNQPRIERATGVLKGAAWSANAGWIPLESTGVAQVKTVTDSAAKTWPSYE